eukprot:749349-Hanusia_phi.AAC.4
MMYPVSVGSSSPFRPWQVRRRKQEAAAFNSAHQVFGNLLLHPWLKLDLGQFVSKPRQTETRGSTPTCQALPT